MVNILCARNRYIVPFMFCSETSYDKLVEEIAKNPLWKIQKMHEQEAEQDLRRSFAVLLSEGTHGEAAEHFIPVALTKRCIRHVRHALFVHPATL